MAQPPPPSLTEELLFSVYVSPWLTRSALTAEILRRNFFRADLPLQIYVKEVSGGMNFGRTLGVFSF